MKSLVLTLAVVAACTESTQSSSPLLTYRFPDKTEARCRWMHDYKEPVIWLSDCDDGISRAVLSSGAVMEVMPPGYTAKTIATITSPWPAVIMDGTNHIVAPAEPRCEITTPGEWPKKIKCPAQIEVLP